MKMYEYALLIDDIVVDAGNIQAKNEVELEKVLKNDIGPRFVWDRLTYKEVA